jgi:uncharacterized membrane protein
MIMVLKLSKTFQTIRAHWSTFVISLLSFIVFVELVQVTSVPMATQFWGDEYYSLWIAMQSTLSGFVSCQLHDGNGPIFNILLWFWYRIVPYGDKYLLLLPQIFVALSVLLTGIATRKLLGNKAGVLASLLILININYIQYGNELRTYSLTVFASALMMWMYFRRLEIMGRESTSSIVTYGLSVALLAYTHYCAFFVCLMFFLSDIVLIIKNKIQRRVMFSYIEAAIIFVPWFIYYIKHTRSSPWQSYIPSATDMFGMLQYLNSNNQVITFICVAAIVFSAIVVLRRDVLNTRLRAMFICSIVAIGYIFIMYASSVIMAKYLTKGTFWVPRYFLVIVPFLIFSISAFFTEIIEQTKIDKKTVIPTVIIISVLVFCLPQQYIQLKSYPSPTQWANWLESAADWLYEQPDIYGSDVGLYYAGYNSSDAWRSYSLEQLGRRPALHYVGIDKTLNTINKLYTVENHVGLSQEQLKILNGQFDLISEDNNLRVKIWQRKERGREGSN